MRLFASICACRESGQMHDNWLSIVRGDGEVRACVFCGQYRRDHCKAIAISTVLAMLKTQEPCLHDELFHRALHNVCHAALASHAAWQHEDREAMLSACLCCHHWVARRKRRKLIFPMQALVWYVNTLMPIGKKNMDHRVVVRLCQTLSEMGPAPKQLATHTASPRHTSPTPLSSPGPSPTEANTRVTNFYATLFSSHEKALFAEIARSNIDNTADIIARYYHTQNACTIFSANSSLVEKLRKGQSRDGQARQGQPCMAAAAVAPGHRSPHGAAVSGAT